MTVDRLLEPERGQRLLQIEPGLPMLLEGEGKLRPQGLRKKERRGILREIPNSLGDISGMHARGVLTRDEHPAGGWSVQTGDEPQQCRLARPIPSHEREQLARPYL